MTDKTALTPSSAPSGWPSREALKFVATLAKLVAPDNPAPAGEALTAMLPMMRDIPTEAWTSRDFLDRCATARKWGVPGYAEIREAWRGWHTARKPAVRFIPAERLPDRIEPTDEERAAVAETLRQYREEIAAKQPLQPRPPVGAKHLSPQQLRAVYREQLRTEAGPFANAALERLKILDAQYPEPPRER